MRRRAFLALAAALAGCAMQAQVPPGPGAAALGRTAVVAGKETPQIRFEGFARSRGEGAAFGGTLTFVSCASLPAGSICAGPYCGGFLVFWLGVCGVAGLVGGGVGASMAPGAEAVREAEARMRAALDVNAIQESLRQQVEIAARSHGVLPASRERAETLIEVTLTDAGTVGAGIDAPVGLRMNARVRALRAGDGAELYRAQYVHEGARLKLAEWAANDGARLLRALEAGYATLAAHVADSVYLLYPFPSQEAGAAGVLSAAFGLAPLDPPTRGTPTDMSLTERFEWPGVASTRPLLRWEAFPRAADVKLAPAEMGRVGKVTYDLVIARERNLAPAEIAYRRSGLAAPEHRVETPLEPRARYYWSVRARFDLDGRPRVTGWASTHYQARDSMTAPSSLSYRFRTP
jgi:hypothetical protein